MSQWECAMELLPEGILDYTMNGREPERIGNRDPLMAPHGIFQCLDRPEKILGITIDQVGRDRGGRRRGIGAAGGAIGRPELASDAKFATLAARKPNEDELEA